MEKTKYIKLKIKAEDHPHISQAFATAIAFFANDRVRNTKEEIIIKRFKDYKNDINRVHRALVKSKQSKLTLFQ